MFQNLSSAQFLLDDIIKNLRNLYTKVEMFYFVMIFLKKIKHLTSIFFAGFGWNKIVIQLCCWHKESIQNTMIIMIPEPGRLKMEAILWPCRKFLVLPLWLMIFKEIPVRYFNFTSFFQNSNFSYMTFNFTSFFFQLFSGSTC